MSEYYWKNPNVSYKTILSYLCISVVKEGLEMDPQEYKNHRFDVPCT